MPAKMKIRSAYSTLPAAERKVADFILANPERAPLMVINEIAAASGVSVPSVTRLAKKLGYSGFLDFRVALASGNVVVGGQNLSPITQGDSDETAIDKIYGASHRALEDTYRALDKGSMIALADAIVAARRIFVYGLSCSGFLAGDFVLQLNYMGFNAVCANDAALMEVYRSRIAEGDVLICLSRSGRGRELLDALRAARENGAVTACMSNYVNSSAASVAGHFFCTCRIEDIKAIAGRETNCTMMALLNILAVLVARRIKKS